MVRPSRSSPPNEEIALWIQASRASMDPAFSSLLSKPERLVRRIILAYQGHVNLRFDALAKDLGVAMRTLERSFKVRYGKTMLQFQRETRLRHAYRLLSASPSAKLSSIADELGYREARDFARFFRRQAGMTPSSWRRNAKP
jgi:transcriptional regulator GlxA family with amidase domain